MVNTLVLLASSRFVALAAQAARAADHRRALRLISAGAACGVVFIAIKIFEWVSEIHHGYTLSTNDFWMFYFMITGVHLFHVAFGLVVLGVIGVELRTPELRRPYVVEAGATYWHMVDLLWVVIFALIYLMR
jgi:nitric oxide reductase NorE protein